MTPAFVLDTLLESALRGAVIAAMVAMVLAACRVKTASIRHAAWTGVLASMLLLPAASAWLPTIPVPDWMPAGSPEIWVTEWATGASPDAPAEAVGPVARASGASAVVREPARSARLEPMQATAESTATTASSLTVRGWIVVMWLVGAAILLLREAAGWWMARRLARQSVRLERADDAGELYQSAHVTTPVVVGVIAPRVLVPESWPRWGADVRSMVVLHERAHITRRDPLIAAAARVNRAVFWFHPLAWWLERHVTRLAERACDEVVVREVQDPRHYAGLLVEMARRLQRHGGRVAWQGIGIASSRRLEERINTVLKGATNQPSWLVKLGVGVVCALLIALGAACERKALALAQDPEVTASMAAEAKRMDAFRAAVAMTPDQVSALERAVATNPEDMDGTRDLLYFYQASGQKVMGWDAMVAARRPHLLRLIERDPESPMAAWSWSRPLDPVGYDAASALWAAHVRPTDISPKLVNAAVRFYELSEPFVAERLLIRAHDQNPTGPPPRVPYPVNNRSWLNYLGNLYGKAIIAEEPGDPRFAEHARRQLADTTRAEILVGAGNHLFMSAGSSHSNRWGSQNSSQRAQGLAFLERAATIDPAGSRTQRALTWAQGLVAEEEEYDRTLALFGRPVHELDAGAFDKLADSVKFEYGHDLLWAPYGAAMGAYHKSDKAAADAALAEFKRRADVMAQVATLSSLPADAAARLAADVHIALGTYAMRQGNHAEAVKRLGQAAEVGAVGPQRMPDFGAESSIANPQATKLTHELLEAGERESVAAFYDVVAGIVDGDERTIREKAAAAIRAGIMPFAYQHYLARQHNAKNANPLKIAK